MFSPDYVENSITEFMNILDEAVNVEAIIAKSSVRMKKLIPR